MPKTFFFKKWENKYEPSMVVHVYSPSIHEAKCSMPAWTTATQIMSEQLPRPPIRNKYFSCNQARFPVERLEHQPSHKA